MVAIATTTKIFAQLKFTWKFLLTFGSNRGVFDSGNVWISWLFGYSNESDFVLLGTAMHEIKYLRNEMSLPISLFHDTYKNNNDKMI